MSRVGPLQLATLGVALLAFALVPLTGAIDPNLPAAVVLSAALLLGPVIVLIALVRWLHLAIRRRRTLRPVTLMAAMQRLAHRNVAPDLVVTSVVRVTIVPRRELRSTGQLVDVAPSVGPVPRWLHGLSDREGHRLVLARAGDVLVACVSDARPAERPVYTTSAATVVGVALVPLRRTLTRRSVLTVRFDDGTNLVALVDAGWLDAVRCFVAALPGEQCIAGRAPTRPMWSTVAVASLLLVAGGFVVREQQSYVGREMRVTLTSGRGGPVWSDNSFGAWCLSPEEDFPTATRWEDDGVMHSYRISEGVLHFDSPDTATFLGFLDRPGQEVHLYQMSNRGLLGFSSGSCRSLGGTSKRSITSPVRRSRPVAWGSGPPQQRPCTAAARRAPPPGRCSPRPMPTGARRHVRRRPDVHHPPPRRAEIG